MCHDIREGTSIWWNYDWLHMTPGAVGCALSHRAIWQNLVHARDAEDCWLVLEDTSPQDLKQFSAILTNLTRQDAVVCKGNHAT